MTLDEPSAARVERAHYQMQSCLYFTEAVDLDGAVAYLAHGISEPEWNHAALLRAESASATAEVLQRIEALFEGREMMPAVEVGPGSSAPGLAAHLADRGFERSYRYSWLAPCDADDADHHDDLENRDDLEIRTAQMPDDASVFLEVFRAAYPDGLESGYERALRRPQSGVCEVVHHLARDGDTPVAVATSIHGLSGDAQGITGLCNLAVHPNWRRRGLGRRLTRIRVDEARRRAHRAFLQTERSSVERWQLQHGFQILFHTEGWVRP